MASTLSAKGRHFGEVPVVEHVVDVGHAEASCVELDEDVVGPGYWNGDGFDFLDIGLGRREGKRGRDKYDVKIRTFVYYYSRLTLFRDDEGLNLFRSWSCPCLNGSCL
jgi:hypothetical protein